MRKPFASLAQLVRQHRAGVPPVPSCLVPLTGFGANPGALDMLAHVPAGLRPGAALVVVLHGCKQDARGYDHGTGWSELAERHGFAVLAPDQRAPNNALRCFNWFDPTKAGRGGGEVGSIAEAVRHMLRGNPNLDPRRVFVTGLSAGGAMTAALLATHPELFAGGAVIAGLPFGVARDGNSAFALMREGAGLSPRELGDRVRAASGHRGPWPAVSVWHGGADATVNPASGRDLVAQWLDVHGLSATPQREPETDGARHLTWRGAEGSVLVESWTLPTLGHGAPIGPSVAAEARRGGIPAPFILDAGIFSTWHIAARWNLLDPDAKPAETVAEAPRAEADRPGDAAEHAAAPSPLEWARMRPDEVIAKAMRLAGIRR